MSFKNDGQAPCDVCKRKSCYMCAFTMPPGTHECQNDECMLHHDGSCIWGLSEKCGASGFFYLDEEDEE